jgi:molecular chaperone Hsp33
MIGAPLELDTELTVDLVQPFQLELSNVRGRAVRLGPVLDDIFRRHNYPARIEQLLAEAAVAAVLLASLLKYDGVFTLQAKGDGAVPLLVADVTSAGAVRAYARFDPDRLEASGTASEFALIGQGYLAFTVQQDGDGDSYQGIVSLTGASLADSLAHYFDQSEQLETVVEMAARRYPDGWRAGAVLLQRLPDDDAGRISKPADEDREDWRRATILLNSVADVELLDRTLRLNGLLFRLFHEDQARAFAPHEVYRACRCSAERVERALLSLSRDELDEMKVDGEVVVTCEFCSDAYRFDEPALARLFAERGQAGESG